MDDNYMKDDVKGSEVVRRVAVMTFFFLGGAVFFFFSLQIFSRENV